MKILHVINNLNTGGAENLVANMTPLIKDKNYDVDVLVLNQSSQIYKEQLIKAGINVYTTGIEKIYSPFQIFKIRKILSKYDIIHSHLFPSQYWVVLSTIFKKNKPILITTEHATHNKRRNYKILSYLDKNIYSKYNKVISNSKETENNLLDFINMRDDRFVVIDNGIELDKFKKGIAYKKSDIDASFKEDDILILQIARFDYEKDQKTLIKTMSLLNSKYKLILAGDGDLRKECEDLVKELKLEDKIKFLGIRGDIPNLIKSSDVCVVSSRIEGFGLTAVESMAAGIPVIASNVEGLNKVVENAGILFQLENCDELKEAIEKLTTDKEYYKKIAEQCSDRANSFDIKKMIDEHCKLYNEYSKKH